MKCGRHFFCRRSPDNDPKSFVTTSLMLENVAALAYIKDKVRHPYPYISTLRLIILHRHLSSSSLYLRRRIVAHELRKRRASGLKPVEHSIRGKLSLPPFPPLLTPHPYRPLSSFNEPNTHPHIPLHPTLSHISLRLPTTKHRYALNTFRGHQTHIRHRHSRLTKQRDNSPCEYPEWRSLLLRLRERESRRRRCRAICHADRGAAYVSKDMSNSRMDDASTVARPAFVVFPFGGDA